jgi:imidazole glycerol-phosphate synthase subunit HisH
MTESRVCILDYGSGNVGSVFNLLQHLGIKSLISNKEKEIQNSTHLILPGVGSFGAAMEKIMLNLPMKLIEDEVVARKKPFLGICIGMQILANYGYEFGKHDGLGWIDGEVGLINAGENPLPHIGWNNVTSVQPSKLMMGLEQINDFYFVNSYCFKVQNIDNLIAETTYHENFASIVGRDNILGVQFHPEKSQGAGQKIIRNFLEYK